ncbi:hypothetical protein OG698_13220 [Streptomyces sp. NBC_01003]|uniref:hypothetical protein n=1 Tax=Streptomyces sp. NBC_01003 TaxID=2903714 RepID=UPI0038680372|nr:hypothetical protein OG698_13220 [Streptomyces sp. NBC_01003]
MPPDPEEHSDPAFTSASLAAEAALLEARLRMLQEEIDQTDAGIETLSHTLRLLHRDASALADPPDGARHCDSSG